ncbi:helix-turn-helix domain-containing protein [Micromonospora sp. NPDC050397]|uniref:helix-turn-helix domain-containing protein n=1 Tax=Micromonospora sp. NPDC050397 TaxID=3364279 RepID=UPI00384BDE45
MRTAVDPRFPSELRRVRTERGLSLRSLERLVYASKSHLGMIEAGTAQPTPALAARLDSALNAGGLLSSLVADPQAELSPEVEDRLRYAEAHPSRADHGIVDGLETLLAGQRRIEDSIGAPAILAPVQSQLALILELVGESRDNVRPRLVQAAAEWAQFGGWVHQACGLPDGADRWLARSLEWATEVGNRDLIYTLLSFRAYLAEDQGAYGSLIGLTRASLADPGAVHVAQRAYDCYQLGRGLARVGEMADARSAIAAGDDLVAAVAEDIGPTPPWHYYRSTSFFEVEAGRALVKIGDRPAAEQAIRRLTTGLAGLEANTEGADWAASYLCDLAVAHGQVSDTASARTILDQARRVGVAMRSRRLLAQVTAAVQQIGASMDTR